MKTLTNLCRANDFEILSLDDGRLLETEVCSNSNKQNNVHTETTEITSDNQNRNNAQTETAEMLFNVKQPELK